MRITNPDYPNLWRDLKWMYAMYRVKVLARQMSFSQRETFWKELKPYFTQGGLARIALPDGIPYITNADVDRALEAALNDTRERRLQPDPGSREQDR